MLKMNILFNSLISTLEHSCKARKIRFGDFESYHVKISVIKKPVYFLFILYKWLIILLKIILIAYFLAIQF